MGGVFVVSSAGDVKQEGGADAANDRYKRTRDKLRQLLLDGQLDAREVEIEVTPSSGPMFDMFASQGAPESMENFTEMLQSMMPQRKKKRTVKVSEARRILLEQEFDKLVDMEDVTADALERVETLGIVFLDEIDKIAGEKSQMGGPDVSREGVQRDLLPIVEGSNVQTKYGMVKTDHILFVAAGAFHVSKPSDLIPELQGRFPIRVELKSAHRSGFRSHHDGAGERSHEAVRRAGRRRRRDARVHRQMASPRLRRSRRRSIRAWRTSALGGCIP